MSYLSAMREGNLLKLKATNRQCVIFIMELSRDLCWVHCIFFSTPLPYLILFINIMAIVFAVAQIIVRFTLLLPGRQRGRALNASVSQYGGPWFECRSRFRFSKALIINGPVNLLLFTCKIEVSTVLYQHDKTISY